ncbi:MAG: nucleotidyltransferase family protein [Kiritimatiellia bacterium]
MLINCLRCAVHNLPPDQWIADVDWAVLLRQARGHSVESYLFPWLCQHLPDQFSSHAAVPEDSPQAAWRSFALKQLGVTIKRQKQAADILSAFAENSIQVTPLKGIWLSEQIYDEPSQRKMVDIDLLVKTDDKEKAGAILTKLKYTSRRAMLESEYMSDLSFYHPAYELFVELHWNVESRMNENRGIPDISTILQRTESTELLGKPVKCFPIEDQLCNLTQHILHHQLALPLKGYIDIALLLNQEKLNIRKLKLDESAADWKTGRAVPFMLKLVAELFELKGIPDELTATTFNSELIQETVNAVLKLPPASSRTREINLLKYKQATTTEKLKLIRKRIFMPQSFMQMHYPFAENRILLPVAWFLRAVSLIESSGKKLISAKTSAPNLANAAGRARIIEQLTGKEN